MEGGAMHQRSSNKKCQTIIEGTELRRHELKLSIVAQFHSTCGRAARALSYSGRREEAWPVALQSHFTLSSPAELDLETWGKKLGI